MEIKVRGVDPVAVRKIDGMAKKRGMSRNEFVKILLEKTAVMKEMEVERDRLNVTMSSYNDLFKLLIGRVDDLEKNNEKLFILISLATDIPLLEVDNFLERNGSKEI